MLIDESERTFKRGMIVTATVTKVMDTMLLCKLDNGLDASVQKNDLEKTEQSLQNIIQVGNIITGRIHEIHNKEDGEKIKFKVSLNCKKKDLESHYNYIDPDVRDHIPQEDLTNHAFVVDKKQAQARGQGGSKFQNRRITHPKFKNIPSLKVICYYNNSSLGYPRTPR